MEPWYIRIRIVKWTIIVILAVAASALVTALYILGPSLE
jgi:hypothetical protein